MNNNSKIKTIAVRYDKEFYELIGFIEIATGFSKSEILRILSEIGKKAMENYGIDWYDSKKCNSVFCLFAEGFFEFRKKELKGGI